jgi:RNA-directed DNA polymerase
MSRWRPQLYKKQGLETSVSDVVLTNAIATAGVTTKANANVPPIFTLRHLAHLADVDYGFLRAIVSRTNPNPYRLFRIRKRPSETGEVRFRVIAVPDPSLLKTQRWITQTILSKVSPHSASVAFSKGDTLIAAAEPHCGSRWLIKLDVRNFFESISEIAVYHAFHSLGYQPLVALELARLCTRLRTSGSPPTRRWWVKWLRWTKILAYQVWRSDFGSRMGHLPQGAPTSPMLANLAMREFDRIVSEIADQRELIYTRYADDLTLSSKDPTYSREHCRAAIGDVYAVMGKYGLSPNATKTKIITPGARKIVLGLLVDGPKPKLLRTFKAMMRQHLYYLKNPEIGVVSHAKRRGFTSVAGLRNHLFGLAHFATQIEPTYGRKCLAELQNVDWPL